MYGNNHGGGQKCMHSDHHDTKEAARQAARKMGMSGCHKMSCNGKTVYMPGSSHSSYMDAKETGGRGGGFDPSDINIPGF